MGGRIWTLPTSDFARWVERRSSNPEGSIHSPSLNTAKRNAGRWFTHSLTQTSLIVSMFGINFIKIQPTTYLLQYRRGRIVREGVGLALFY